MKRLLALLLLTSLASAEEYICRPPAPQQTCPCRIVVKGKGITTVSFRKGDIVSTEAGWLPDPERGGWVKLKKDALPANPSKLPAVDLWILPSVIGSPAPNVLCLVGLEASRGR